MAKLIVPLIARLTAARIKKRGRLTKTTTTKRAKKSQTSLLLDLFRFSSPISRLGCEVFHWVDCSVFLPHLSFGLGGFLLNQSGQIFTDLPHQSSVFLPRLLLGLGGFSPNILRIFWFSSSVSYWVRRFFIDWSRIFFIVPSGLGAWYLEIWFFSSQPFYL